MTKHRCVVAIKKTSHHLARHHVRALLSFHSEPASEDHDEAQRARMYVPQDADYLHVAKQAAAFTRLQSIEPKPDRTALYRHLDADGALLYVGISLSVPQRTGQHRRGQPWFGDVVRINIEWFNNRRDAMRAEHAAIKTERPLYNRTYAVD